MEHVLDGTHTSGAYPFHLHEPEPGRRPSASVSIDWRPMFEGLLEDIEDGISIELISARFHNTLVNIIVAVAGRFHCERIVLTGGCFQNRYLTEGAVGKLRAKGIRPYWHQRVPPNDGGLALGQAAALQG
jgi:hydrogenase maturation protein HypF